MSHSYKICSPSVPGGGAVKVLNQASSEQMAVSERVDNVRVLPLSELANHRENMPGGFAFPGTTGHKAMVSTLKLWDNGKTLRVRFVDGDPEVQQKVEAIAREWEGETNLTLKFVRSDAAEIRISFAEKGFSWSAVGTDARTVPNSQATMNYGWLEPSTAMREYQRVVRHEFGHALGMLHEHQNPTGSIPWDKPKVYAYYAQQGWTKEDVDFNIFDVVDEDSTNHTSFDPTSIMQYAVPDSLTIGSFAIGWNTDLSSLDKQFMRLQYPKNAPGLQEVVPNGNRVEADLAASGEVDTYHFEAATAGTHILTTQGPSDTVLTLHGPNDPGAVLAWDDDRGRGTNARIVRKLLPGQYWLSVRHKDTTATGTYSVGVTTRR